MSNKKRNQFSIADRKRAVLMVIDQEESYESVARQLATSSRLVSRWVGAYRIHGDHGLSLKNKSGYSPDFKLDLILEMHNERLSLSQASARHRVSGSVIAGWMRKYEQGGAAALLDTKQEMKQAKVNQPENGSSAEYAELLKENERLRIENAFLKKVQALALKNGARPSGSDPKQPKS